MREKFKRQIVDRTIKDVIEKAAAIGFELHRNLSINEQNAFIDPGHKKENSIYNNVTREFIDKESQWQKDWQEKCEHESPEYNPFSFIMGDMSDLVRGTVSAEGYQQVIDDMKKLSKMIPNFHARIKGYKSGYVGIHANIMIDNIIAELQFTTPESFALKKVADQLYSAHRSVLAKDESMCAKGEMQKREIAQELIELERELHYVSGLVTNREKWRPKMVNFLSEFPSKPTWNSFDNNKSQSYDPALTRELNDGFNNLDVNALSQSIREVTPHLPKVQAKLGEFVVSTLPTSEKILLDK